LREDEKDRLRYVFGVFRIPGVSQGDRLDEIEVPPDKFSKRRFRIAAGVFPDQVHVVRVRHPF